MSATLTEQLIPVLRRPVPRLALQQAALHLMDWVAAAAAAQSRPEGAALLALASRSSSGPAWVPGLAGREAATAAFVNAGLALTLEMDSTHREAKLHPGPPVIAAALAVGQRERVDGQRLLASIVRGYEAMIRVGQAFGPKHYLLWHTTGTAGVFGAAAAVADLIGLDDESFADALGNAGTRSAGLWQTRLERAMAKPLHAGGAAQTGLYAADLAAAGLRGPREILEGDMGLFAACCPDPDAGAVTRKADGPWKIHETSLKPWPACRHVHPAIDAALQTRAALVSPGAQRPPREIRRVEVTTYPEALDFADNPAPVDEQAAMFSLQHCVALALVKGAVHLADFTSAARLADADVAAVRGVVVVRAAEPFTSDYPVHWGARVHAVGADGEGCTELRDTRGDPERPIPLAQLNAKVGELLASVGVTERQSRELVETVSRLPDGHVADLGTVLP